MFIAVIQRNLGFGLVVKGSGPRVLGSSVDGHVAFIGLFFYMVQGFGGFCGWDGLGILCVVCLTCLEALMAGLFRAFGGFRVCCSWWF